MKAEPVIQNKTPKTTLLKDVTPGSIIRFEHDSFVDALKADLFWLRVDAPEIKDGRVRLVNLKDGKQIERDADRRVFVETTAYIALPVNE